MPAARPPSLGARPARASRRKCCLKEAAGRGCERRDPDSPVQLRAAPARMTPRVVVALP